MTTTTNYSILYKAATQPTRAQDDQKRGNEEVEGMKP